MIQKERLNITLDDDVIKRIKRDKGTLSLSTYLNLILRKILFGEDFRIKVSDIIKDNYSLKAKNKK